MFGQSKNQICASQVNGHLDYMRQMDTILVAVGVPTKEVPGASLALHRPATVAKGTEEILDQVSHEQQVTQKQSQTEDGANCSEETVEVADMTGDGWDIPDISDLLESLSDSESVSHTEVRNISPLTPKEEGAPEEISACKDFRDSAGDDNKHIMELGWHPQTKIVRLVKSVSLDQLLSARKKKSSLVSSLQFQSCWEMEKIWITFSTQWHNADWTLRWTALFGR